MKYEHIYSPAYTNSNEPMRWAVSQFPDASRVLTVAASGDQAMFHKLAGATHIDTFDFTPYARVIQDIKVLACGSKSHDEYIAMLKTLNRIKRADRIEKLDCVSDILPRLPNESTKIMAAAARFSMDLCGAGAGITSYPYNIPTPDEYARLGREISEPFNFVFSDIATLGTKIDAQYDLINTSNIFDWVLPGQNKMYDILTGLTGLLDVGGRIIYLPQYGYYNFPGLKLNCMVGDTERRLEYVETRWLCNPRAEMIVLQRTR